MAGETMVTLIGNLTADPESRVTPSGAVVANFTIASTPRTFDKQANDWRDGDPLFVRAAVWGASAQHVLSSLKKGTRVIAHGAIGEQRWEDKDGTKRSSVVMTVVEIGPALRNATAVVTRVTTGGQPAPAQQAAPSGWQQPAPGWGGEAAPF